MRQVLLILQIVISLALIGTILLQARGTGLGSAWGGGGETYRSKRGVERLLMYATITLVIFFLILAVANLIVG